MINAALLVLLCAGCLRDGAKMDHADLATAVIDLGDAFSPADSAAVTDGATSDGAVTDGAVTECSLAISATWLDLVGAIVAAMKTSGGADSQAVTATSSSERDLFATQVLATLAGDASAACALPAPYRLLIVTSSAGPLRVVAEVDGAGAPAPQRFWGTYAAPVTTGVATRLLAIEAPHPIFDTDTEKQAADLFAQGSARWFLLAGSHRCANAASSGCDGTTTACSPTAASYRISDAAHATQLPFWAVHAQLSSLDATLVFLQLHGNSQACPTALLGDGSDAWTAQSPTGRLAAALVARAIAVGECGAGYPKTGCNLCGTDNVEGRVTAGAANACTDRGTSYGRFIHLEQQPSLRKQYQPLIDAVLATF